MLLNNALAKSHIRHRRYNVDDQKAHAFEYDMAYVLLDLDGVESMVKKSPFWSLNAFNLIGLQTKDWFFPEYAVNNYTPKTQQESVTPVQIKAYVVDAVNQQYNQSLTPNACKVMLLTLPRYFNHGFNPVSFYFVFQTDEALSEYKSLPEYKAQPKYIVADITNTPWDERQAYVLECEENTKRSESTKARSTCQFSFDKLFHVSPFMHMNMFYDWRFSFSDDGIIIHMRLIKNSLVQRDSEPVLLFDATMNMTLQPLTTSHMNWLPMRYPLQSLKVVAGIYWQALKLKLKGNTFYSHPQKSDSGITLNDKSKNKPNNQQKKELKDKHTNIPVTTNTSRG